METDGRQVVECFGCSRQGHCDAWYEGSCDGVQVCSLCSADATVVVVAQVGPRGPVLDAFCAAHACEEDDSDMSVTCEMPCVGNADLLASFEEHFESLGGWLECERTELARTVEMACVGVAA